MQMESDDFILRSEQPHFKLVTATEEVAGTAGGLCGMLGSTVTLVALSNAETIPDFISTTPQPITTPDHQAPPLQYEIGGVVGMTIAFAFAAAAVSSGIRYAIHRRKVNFKSDISAEMLRKWHDSQTAPASRDR